MTRIIIGGIAAALLLAGCAAPPQTAFGAKNPADAGARTRPAAYRPVVADYEPIRPSAARDWREMNRRVTPGGANP